MTIIETITAVLAGWVALSFTVGAAYGTFSWFFGTSEHNRRGTLAARRLVEAQLDFPYPNEPTRGTP